MLADAYLLGNEGMGNAGGCETCLDDDICVEGSQREEECETVWGGAGANAYVDASRCGFVVLRMGRGLDGCLEASAG